MSRRRFQKSSRLQTGLVAGAVICCSASVVLAVTEPWEQVLSQQLAAEQMCDMTGTYNVQEFPLGDDVAMIGKARCYDGREFDFSQKKQHMKFDITPCEPNVC